MGCGLKRQDAEHIAQAVSNECDVFLTRDEATIVKYRDAIQALCPNIRIRLPSELLRELAP
jgi:hypothetical protein